MRYIKVFSSTKNGVGQPASGSLRPIMKFLSIAHALPSARVTNQALLEEIINCSRKHLSLKELKTLEKKVLRFFKMSRNAVALPPGDWRACGRLCPPGRKEGLVEGRNQSRGRRPASSMQGLAEAGWSPRPRISFKASLG